MITRLKKAINFKLTDIAGNMWTMPVNFWYDELDLPAINMVLNFADEEMMTWQFHYNLITNAFANPNELQGMGDVTAMYSVNYQDREHANYGPFAPPTELSEMFEIGIRRDGQFASLTTTAKADIALLSMHADGAQRTDRREITAVARHEFTQRQYRFDSELANLLKKGI